MLLSKQTQTTTTTKTVIVSNEAKKKKKNETQLSLPRQVLAKIQFIFTV